MIRKKLFNFLKKQTSRILQDKTDFIIISVLLIMIIFCIINNAVSQKDDQENPPGQLEVAGIMTGMASGGEGSADADVTELPDPDFQVASDSGEIPEGNGMKSELSQSSEDEDANIKNDIIEDSTALENENGNTAIEEDQAIDFTSSDDFRIEVDLGKQKVFVYYREEIIREMICSGGDENSPTPTGEFTTSEKIKYDWVDRFDMGAYYWTRFYESYLFHSIPFDKNGDMMMEEYEKLGSPASHGCIRLKLEEAKWLYEKIPVGVKVIIY